MRFINSQQNLINQFSCDPGRRNNVQSNRNELIQMKPGYLDCRSLAKIKSDYSQSKKRLILFDFDGTLVPLASSPDAAKLNKEAETFIRKLVEDDRNRVVIVSGRERAFLEDQFENLHVTLIA